MIKKISLALASITLLSVLLAGCSQAPAIPHPSEGLNPVDCLACHELGLKGATKIPEGHLDDQGDVKYDSCGCHKPMPAEEQSQWGQSGQRRASVEMTGLVLGSIGLAVIGVLVVSGRERRDLDS